MEGNGREMERVDHQRLIGLLNGVKNRAQPRLEAGRDCVGSIQIVLYYRYYSLGVFLG